VKNVEIAIHAQTGSNHKARHKVGSKLFPTLTSAVFLRIFLEYVVKEGKAYL